MLNHSSYGRQYRGDIGGSLGICFRSLGHNLTETPCVARGEASSSQRGSERKVERQSLRVKMST